MYEIIKDVISIDSFPYLQMPVVISNSMYRKKRLLIGSQFNLVIKFS